MRLLYVEDERTTAKIVSALLRQAGFGFDAVFCGKDAVQRARSNAYDLVLLDIMLPDFDGYEVIERVRRAGIETPFLIQTGLIARGAKDRDGASLGVADYLIKPFNRAELIDKINAVIGRSKQVRDVGLKVVDPVQPYRRGGKENRGHRRFNSLKDARVVHPYIFDCVLLNMSYAGAAIQLPHPDRPLGTHFRLDVFSGPKLECEVRWRYRDKVGVRFV